MPAKGNCHACQRELACLPKGIVMPAKGNCHACQRELLAYLPKGIVGMPAKGNCWHACQRELACLPKGIVGMPAKGNWHACQRELLACLPKGIGMPAKGNCWQPVALCIAGRCSEPQYKGENPCCTKTTCKRGLQEIGLCSSVSIVPKSTECYRDVNLILCSVSTEQAPPPRRHSVRIARVRAVVFMTMWTPRCLQASYMLFPIITPLYSMESLSPFFYVHNDQTGFNLSKSYQVQFAGLILV